MKHRYLPFILNLFVCLSAILFLNEQLQARSNNGLDLLTANEIAHIAAQNYTDLKQADFPRSDLKFVILNADDELLFNHDWPDYSNLYNALRERAAVLNLPERSDRAKLVIQDSLPEQMAGQRRQTLMIVLAALVFILVINFIYLLYLQRRIVSPFQKMQDFAVQIARGNFNRPLTMDKDNLFGAFTESFDLMRSELEAAKVRERQAMISKQELVAELSHDIKTPLASIEAVSELGVLKTKDIPDLQKQFSVIQRKSEQINQLITELFQAALDDLETLSVETITVNSDEITAMIDGADHKGLCKITPWQPCLVQADPLRLQQVIDNIIINSYKYADTKIEVSGAIKGRELVLKFSDDGPGVPETELPFLSGKFYRGSNSEGAAGTGLGLYISTFLMERMGGALSFDNLQPGFAVTLVLTLS